MFSFLSLFPTISSQYEIEKEHEWKNNNVVVVIQDKRKGRYTRNARAQPPLLTPCEEGTCLDGFQSLNNDLALVAHLTLCCGVAKVTFQIVTVV